MVVRNIGAGESRYCGDAEVKEKDKRSNTEGAEENKGAIAGS